MSERNGIPDSSGPTGRRSRRRWIVVGAVAAVVVSVAFVVTVLLPPAASFAPQWTIPFASSGKLGLGIVSNGTYYSYEVYSTFTNGTCGQSENFTTLAIDLGRGAILWNSSPVSVPCTYYFGFPERIVVLPSQIVLIVTMNAYQGPGSRLFFTSFNRSTGELERTQVQSVGGPSGLNIGSGDWPVVDGRLFTWSVVNSTDYNVTAYSLSTFEPSWEASLAVPQTGIHTLDSAGFPDSAPGGFAVPGEFCLTTDPEGSSDFPASFQFNNGSIACLSADSGRLLWQRNSSGTAAFELGTLTPTGWYYLDNYTGVLRADGFQLATGASLPGFPIVGMAKVPVSGVRLTYVGGLLIFTTVGPYGSTFSWSDVPGTPWGVYQAYQTNGTRLWNVSLPLDGGPGAYYFVNRPMPLSGERILLSDTLGGTYNVATGVRYSQTFEVVNATTGEVLFSHTLSFDKEIPGQFGGTTLGAWVPLLTVGSSLLFESNSGTSLISF